jgi:hypothetical protein
MREESADEAHARFSGAGVVLVTASDVAWRVIEP